MKERYIGKMTRLEFAKEVSQAKGVILVIGSCEQHGYHLPLDTDSIIGLEMAKAIAAKTNCLVMPPVNYGQVFSAQNFPRTFGISKELLAQILKEIILNLKKNGAKNILLYTSHGGNKSAMTSVARTLLQEEGMENVWYFGPIFTPEIREIVGGKNDGRNHAGALETSLILYLKEHLVDMEKATAEYPVSKEDEKYRPILWEEIIESGAFGDATVATKEKGKMIFDDVVEKVSQKINDVIQ